jgi:hypothetical protein
MCKEYVYYNCIRQKLSLQKYSCQAFEDPLEIPVDTQDTQIILPISKFYPRLIHSRLLRKELQKQVEVTIEERPTWNRVLLTQVTRFD